MGNTGTCNGQSKLLPTPPDSLQCKRNVEQQLEDLRNSRLVRVWGNEEVEYLYHCTTEVNRDKIKVEGVLTANRVTAPGMILETGPVKGVWFSPTLFQGRLPTMSPYGTERIKIPIADLCEHLEDWLLFYECAYRYEGRCIQYIRLVLADRSKDTNEGSIQWCRDNLAQLNIANNPLFFFENDMTARCLANKPEPYTFIEVLIVGDIEVLVSYTWDDPIQQIARQTTGKAVKQIL